MKGGDAFEFHRSQTLRVSGFLVACVLGHDRDRDIYDEDGKRRKDCARVTKGSVACVSCPVGLCVETCTSLAHTCCCNLLLVLFCCVFFLFSSFLLLFWLS